MKRFIIEQCDEELYTVHTGLALVGLCLNRFTTMDRQLARRVGRCRGISHADVLKSYVGLLSLGKSDYDAITDKIRDEYFNCLLYTSPSPRDKRQSRMPSSA